MCYIDISLPITSAIKFNTFQLKTWTVNTQHFQLLNFYLSIIATVGYRVPCAVFHMCIDFSSPLQPPACQKSWDLGTLQNSVQHGRAVALGENWQILATHSIMSKHKCLLVPHGALGIQVAVFILPFYYALKVAKKHTCIVKWNSKYM